MEAYFYSLTFFPAVFVFVAFTEEDITWRVSARDSELETFLGSALCLANQINILESEEGGRDEVEQEAGEVGREGGSRSPRSLARAKKIREVCLWVWLQVLEARPRTGVASREIILMDFLDSLISIWTSSECW